MIMNYNVIIKMINLSLCLCFIGFVCAADVPKPPKGWMQPLVNNLYNLDNWRNESDSFFIADSGDYDGDGLIDYSALFLNEDFSEEGLFVYLAVYKNWQKLDSVSVEDKQVFMGLETITQKVHETSMCFNFDDKNNCITELKTGNESILYFRHASSSVIFWWNKSKGKFSKFWLGS